MTVGSTSSAKAIMSFGELARAVALGAGIAVAGNLALLLIANILNISLTVFVGPPAPGAQTMTIDPFSVVVSSALPAPVGALVYWLLTRFSRRGREIFIAVAGVVFLLSLLPIFAQPLTPTGMIVLILMHLVAAGAITWSLVSRAPRRA
jgi:hypothetical protein